MPARARNLPQLAVTDQHRQRAFEAMHWTGWTFEAAMADEVRSRVGNRLHWPDGRVTPFAEHPGLPA